VIRSSGFEHLNGSLVVPVFDEEGRVAELHGRKITQGLRPGTPLLLHLPSQHRGVWHTEALKASHEIILAVGFDWLDVWARVSARKRDGVRPWMPHPVHRLGRESGESGSILLLPCKLLASRSAASPGSRMHGPAVEVAAVDAAGSPDWQELIERLRTRAGFWLLESTLAGGRVSGWSFVGCDPYALLRVSGDRIEVSGRRAVGDGWPPPRTVWRGDPFDALRDWLPRTARAESEPGTRGGLPSGASISSLPGH